jgi:ribonuclease HII
LRAMHAFFVGWKYSATWLQARIVSQQYEVCLIIDGPHDFGLRKALSIEVVPVIDGDALIPMVGAASILAKVERHTWNA